MSTKLTVGITLETAEAKGKAPLPYPLTFWRITLTKDSCDGSRVWTEICATESQARAFLQGMRIMASFTIGAGSPFEPPDLPTL
jgi:hypothetical protein